MEPDQDIAGSTPSSSRAPWAPDDESGMS